MLNKLSKDLRLVSDGADLLTSILIRYSELGSVHYECEQHVLKFAFMIRQQKNLAPFEDILRPALELYHHLEGQTVRVFEITCRTEENVTVLTVVRDLESVRQREVGLMVELLRRKFEKELVYDEMNLDHEDLTYQEEIISQMLTSIKLMDIPRNVLALRDEGRVLVFNN
ncbi:hypothetical protein [Candidatus Desulfosporosinus nitrosoreducens]|uniref:hypothetical protein n=1 Tax=Candidatus Desulfosporosinus nitrosoreducens TaxID=3401928 RepID=UPI00280BC04E|nr:hypothetical protein [Desulfosporosinus sp. PR]